MANWQRILKNSITNPQDLPANIGNNSNCHSAVTAIYPMRLNEYYLNLIREEYDPIWLQAIPQDIELQDDICHDDPLNEENLSPTTNLIHKYPDRVLFLVSSQCAMYCRFCTRKRKVGTNEMFINDQTIQAGLDYIKKNPAIKDVLVSGGDPLLLGDEKLDWILGKIREIPTVEIIRIGSRVPCTLPMRVTDNLCQIIKKHHPVYINTHFNHPREITKEASKACNMLANAGIPLGCQTVLLKGVNDRSEIIIRLMRKLLTIRVKPYYLFQGDLTKGTNHFRTSIELGQEIMKELIGHISGLAVPTYAIDGPGGVGKIPLTPNYIQNLAGNLQFTNYQGKTCYYENGY